LWYQGVACLLSAKPSEKLRYQGVAWILSGKICEATVSSVEEN